MNNQADILQQNSPQLMQVPNSFPWPKVILLVLAISIPVGIGGYILGTQNNQSPQNQQANPPTISQPSPTINPTANWKTYTDIELGYSLKYPPMMNAPYDSNNPLPEEFVLYKNIVEKERISKIFANPEKYPKDFIIDGLFIRVNKEKDTLNNLLKPYRDIASIKERQINIPNIQNVSVGPFPSIGETYQQLVYITNPKGEILKFDAGFKPNDYPEGYSLKFSEIFEQILSTFKFTDQNQITATIKPTQ